ncbi:Signal transduction histidine kinase CheA [Candidatus Nitrotoga sp. BS]|uniref:chemotaxis protein CheA n=1 Tax=Candidatus Nitrotoga sp. BS TaxID=2890408 RepID=UPI001EF32BBA|nr:chemotaxis protein CheA [Candidatus Nitrotoga sp. BS]CAH1205939.1 Signal transduction histidine kinase CheA [Candidatus Nitrotoga sp. BS]
MNDFAGMEELMQDFLTEASELLSDVDSKLIDLEKQPHDRALLNIIFRGFHTIKGGAGFLNATELVTLCHLTENLFDNLRNGELVLDAVLMDAIFAATGEVRQMFDALAQYRQPEAAPPHLIATLHAALNGEVVVVSAVAPQVAATESAADNPLSSSVASLDWNVLHQALVGSSSVPVQVGSGAISASAAATSSVPAATQAPLPPAGDNKPSQPESNSFGRRCNDIPGNKAPAAGRRENEAGKDNTIRVDTDRLDQVLNLSGEIGLTKNRLTHLRTDILQGRSDSATLLALDESVSQLDMLVVNLQNAVMKTRMQPIGRLFNKYPRLARDLARQLGKDVELVLSGEETEIDKTMIEDLNDPLVHLIRNAVDHGVETSEQRAAAGKTEKSLVHLSAKQEGDHIIIRITDDGKGMRPEVIRNKAIDKGLISAESASSLDEEQSLSLILLPGFSTKDEISSVSGRGVGMDVVKTNIEKLSGTISITSVPGKGSEFTISLPLTLAILPVLLLRLCNQSFAVPLSLVREILSVPPNDLQQIAGKATMVVRGEVLPVLSLASLIGWEQTDKPEVGVLMQIEKNSFILSADGFAGHDDVVIKSLDTFRPKGVAGVTMSSEGEIILILDIKELFGEHRR